MTPPTTFLSTLVLLFGLNTLVAQSTTEHFDSIYAQKLQMRLNNIGITGGYQGLSAAVLVPGQGIWSGTYGASDSNNSLTTDMRLGLASNSKAVTAGLILKLQDAGLLDIDDEIGDYLPTYEHVDPSITIRQLLTHTSGLFDFINDWTTATSNTYFDQPNKLWSLDQLIATMGPPESDPGLRYSYSNSNFLLLGKIAEIAGGGSVRNLLHQYIFNPLEVGLIYPPYDNVFSGPWGNLWNTSGTTPSLSTINQRGFLSFPATAGSIWATPFEMVRWYSALFGEEFLQPESQYDLRDNDGAVAYGMGIRLRNEYNRSLYYHAGAWGYRSYLVYDPSTGIALCLISNQYGTSVGSEALELLGEVFNEQPQNATDVRLLNPIPNGRSCTVTDPFIIIKNEGTAPLYQVDIAVSIDGAWLDTLAIDLGGGLAANQQQFTQLNFDLSPWQDNLTHQFRLRAILPDQDEQAIFDNEVQAQFAFSTTNGSAGAIPYLEDFETDDDFPTDFLSSQSSNILDWKTTGLAGATGQRSLARINYHDGNIDQTYRFDLPPLSLPGTGSQLSFAFAHANYPGVGREALRGYISTNCGLTFTPLFSLEDLDLATIPATDELFLPSPEQWQNHTVDLSTYVNEEVVIRFELENQFGNHTFIDDIAVEAVSSTTNEEVTTQIDIAPNPTHARANITWPQEEHWTVLKVYSSNSQLLSSYSLAGNSIQIKTDAWPRGFYTLHFIHKNGQQTMRKLLVQ